MLPRAILQGSISSSFYIGGGEVGKGSQWKGTIYFAIGIYINTDMSISIQIHNYMYMYVYIRIHLHVCYISITILMKYTHICRSTDE